MREDMRTESALKDGNYVDKKTEHIFDIIGNISKKRGKRDIYRRERKHTYAPCLQILSYIIAAILGAAGEATLM